MSESHKDESLRWIDNWFPFFVIVFGLLFLTILVTFAPVN